MRYFNRRNVLSGIGGIVGASTIGTSTTVAEKENSTSGRRSPFRVMSYNIHSGTGTDGIYDLSRIADVIAKVNPDVVALQEVHDQNRASWQDDSPTNYDAQHELLADWLGMEYIVFGAQRDWPVEGGYRRRAGNVILSKQPILQSTVYPYSAQESNITVRNLVETRLKVAGSDVWFYNTHLNQNQGEFTAAQAAELLEIAGTRDGPQVLAGDFNMFYERDTYNSIADVYTDVLRELGEDVPTAPTHSDPPWGPYRLDYIFASDSIDIRGGERITHETEHAPSDHYPVVADLMVPKGRENRGKNKGNSSRNRYKRRTK